jgi:2-hydroxychromene-2-carboxylate isomerase
LPGIAEQLGAQIEYKPMLLGGVFKATNNQPPMVAFSATPEKIDYMRHEIARFVRRHALPFKFNPHFPVMTIATMRGAIFAQGQPWEAKYIDTVMDAIWCDEQKMDDLDVMAEVLDKAGLPATDIMAAIQTDGVKSTLADLTASAVDRKVFGTPTMFVGDQMFFGKDSLDDLAWVLSQA